LVIVICSNLIFVTVTAIVNENVSFSLITVFRYRYR